MEKKGKILYAEDDEVLAFVTKDNLELEGYEITHCLNGRDALDAFHNDSYDLCLLDIMMPEMDGFTLGENIRNEDINVPIIYLTAKSLKDDKIHGLKLGADDYITKPFSIEELILKIEIFMKRNRVEHHILGREVAKFQLGAYLFDYKNLILRLKTEERQLTQKEGDLLRFIILNRADIIKRSDILKAIWGEDDYFLGRSLDVFISRLRKYLKGDPRLEIKNIHGVGFKLLEKEG